MDAELNEIMARDDKEYELFQKMDQERYEREGQEERIKHVQKNLNLDRFPSSFNYRLIQDFEVPEWI
jgi:ATP-dependent helicase STH1/SNF2